MRNKLNFLRKKKTISESGQQKAKARKRLLVRGLMMLGAGVLLGVGAYGILARTDVGFAHYKNDNFSIKYPSSFKVDAHEDGTIAFDAKDGKLDDAMVVNVKTIEGDQEKTFKERIERFKKEYKAETAAADKNPVTVKDKGKTYRLVSFSEVTINGETAYRSQLQRTEDNKPVNLLVIEGITKGKAYNIRIGDTSSDKQLTKKINRSINSFQLR